MAVNPTAAAIDVILKRTDKAESRPQNREERIARREARRAERERQSSAQRSDAAITVTASSSTTTATETPSSATPVPAPSVPKSYLGSLNGANIVHFAVQGGAAGNSIAVFASGEGPHAVQPGQTSAQQSSTPNSNTTNEPAAIQNSNTTVNKTV